MSDTPAHIERIRDQFTRQADAYVRMAQTTNERGLERLVALSRVTPGQRVLDVACGPGFLTMTFAAAGAPSIGIDATGEFLSRAAAEAQRRGLSNVEFHSGDAEHLPFDSAQFDVVACRAAFHHFPRPQRVLAEMARVARPGGRLVIADMLTSEDPRQSAYHNRIERLCDPTHTRALSKSEFETLFQAAGLTILEQRQSKVDYELDEWIAHGGPSAAEAREIHELMSASLERDLSGLNVRNEGGRLHFSHVTAAYVLVREEALI